MELRIRRASTDDKRAVLEVVRTIWGGEDYIPEVFDRWVRDRRGPLYVAEARGRVVGLGKLTLVSPAEAWLQGLRVAPRWRRRGIAGALLAARLDRARELGARTVRFSTAANNRTMQRLARSHRFRLRARWLGWEAPAARGDGAARATPADLDRLWALGRGDLVRLGDEWAWRALTRDDIARAIRESRCVYLGDPPSVTAILAPDGDRLAARHLSGKARALRDFLRALPAEAARRGHPSIMVSLEPRRAAMARALGYRLRWRVGTLIFERSL